MMAATAISCAILPGTSRSLTPCSPRRLPLAPRPAASSQTTASSIKPLTSRAISLAAAALIALTPAPAALANGERLAEFATSGLLPVPGIFRDTVQVVALEDPGVPGVVIYYTDYSRSLQDKFSQDPFADPSQSSLTCLATAPVHVGPSAEFGGSDGKEIFSELKTLNLFQNKRLNVRRIYDEKNGALLYVSYSSRFSSAKDEGGVSSSRYRTSICAIPVIKSANATSSQAATQ